MPKETPVVGTIGLKIIIDVDLDVSGATLLQLNYQKPSGATGNFPGTYELNGSDHTVYYITTDAADIDEAGYWLFQAYVEQGANRFYGTTAKTKSFVAQL